MDNQEKYEVIAKLQNGVAPRVISDLLDVSYGAVLKLRREFEQAKADGTVDQLLDMEKLVVDNASEILETLPAVNEAVSELSDKIDGLGQLSLELQSTATLINTRVRSFMLSINSVSELEILTDVLCKLQTSFVNKNMTQVNVQNNTYGSGTPKYNQFLGDKPVD